MKVGILCAGDREVAPFLPMIEEQRITEKAMLRFYEGKMENVNVAVLFSGVCKVNAAIAAQILLDTYQCDAIINAGTAGAVVQGLNVMDTVVCTETAYHDVAAGILTEFHPWMKDIWMKADAGLLSIAQMVASQEKSHGTVVFGRMATGEAFIADDQYEKISARFAPYTVDMETASIAHVCYVNQKPFIAVRTVVDTPEHSGLAAFEANCAQTSKKSAAFVRDMLRLGKWNDK